MAYSRKKQAVAGAKGGAKEVPKGFSMMDPQRRRELAVKGGYNSRKNRPKKGSK